METKQDGQGAQPVPPSEPVHTFTTGAQRSELKPRYDLIPRIALVRLAARFEMGLKYGEHNYKKGLPFDDTFNHIIDHLYNYAQRRKAILQRAHEQGTSMDAGILYATMRNEETDGDDLSAAMWGIAAIMYLEANGRLG